MTTGIRESLVELLSSFDMNACAFGSAADYMACSKPDLPACLILDVQLPDMNGLDLQGRIAQGDAPHIVFITGHGDIPSSVRAIKAGAVDFLTKPFKQEDLMRAVESALAQNRKAKGERAELAELRQRLSSLTPRELEVLPLIVGGLLNKQAAAEPISENTADSPRQHHEEDARRIAGRTGEDRRHSRNKHRSFAASAGLTSRQPQAPGCSVN
jgi:FixJ family two-component response regulator